MRIKARKVRKNKAYLQENEQKTAEKLHFATQNRQNGKKYSEIFDLSHKTFAIINNFLYFCGGLIICYSIIAMFE